MSTTAYGVNSAEAVKLWSRKLAHEVRKTTYIDRFIGEGSDSLIQMKSEAKKDSGDRIRVILRMLLTGDGVVGDQPLEGNEESLTTYTDDLIINQLRHAVRSQGKMSEQRIPFEHRAEAKDGLRDWWAERMDYSFFNHICGYTVANTTGTGTGTPYIAGNTILAPSSGRKMTSNSGVTNDEGLGSSDLFTLTTIDRAVEKAKVATPKIRPINYKGGKYYVMFLHPYQVTDLRTTTSTGQWLDIQKSAMMGDGSQGNPIFTGALGMYNGVILHEAYRVTQGVNSSTGAAITTVRRSVLCGAQSAFIGFGKGSSFKQMDWREELFDYGNQLGVEAGFVFGIKKAQFNSTDFGTIVASSYAAAH